MPWSEIFRFFYIIGFVNSIFFSILIFSKNKKTLADNILGSWLIFLSLQFLVPFLYLANFDKYLQFAGYEVIIFTLHPIFIYFYIQALTQEFIKKKPIYYAISLIVMVIVSMIPFFFLNNQERIDMIKNHDYIDWTIIPGFVLIITVFCYYLIAGFIALKKHKNKTLHVYSYRDNVDLLWLRRLLVSFTLIFVLSVPISILLFTFDLSLALSDYIYYSFLVGFVIFLGFWGYQQGSVFNQEKPSDLNTIKSNDFDNHEEYIKESKELEKIMEKEKPYLDPSLTIHQLAIQVNLTPHLLSKIIHRKYHKNFFEFINAYRVKHFKELCANAKFKNFTILGIALECGFNSKSAFNRVFKEQTGMTPGEFKKTIA